MINKRPENKYLMKTFTKKYNIKQVIISAYNLKANEMIKKGHKLIKAALTKMTDEEEEN